MLKAATNASLDRDTRKALSFSLVAHLLNCFWYSEAPQVPIPRLMQMLRASDDEVRAHSADALRRFVDDLSVVDGARSPALAASVFDRAVLPFLARVWPQERSLSTPGLSRALADLPASTGPAFSAAVEAISRFLVPFDAWSMIEFGLYESDESKPRLALIDDAKKGRSLLQLLDLSIGHSDTAVVPHDLASVLDKLLEVDASLAIDRRFRRLATLSRR